MEKAHRKVDMDMKEEEVVARDTAAVAYAGMYLYRVITIVPIVSSFSTAGSDTVSLGLQLNGIGLTGPHRLYNIHRQYPPCRPFSLRC